MEIILGKTAGFCYGVRNAVQKAEEKLKEYNELFCLGELVHNGQVIKKLEKSGLKLVERIDEAKGKVIIRAHGISKEIYNKAKRLNIEVFDFTCPNVLKIHGIADEYKSKGYYIFLVGGKKHPESLGTISFCGKESYLIETKEDIDEAIKSFKKSNIKKLLIIVQTTFNLEKFNNYVEQIKQKLDENIEIQVKNTICNATKIRQEETCEISKKVQCMIIIGGKNSSNTKKLYDIAKENCKNTIIVETKDELDMKNINQFEKIGIMAGASTPEYSINDIIDGIRANVKC